MLLTSKKTVDSVLSAFEKARTDLLAIAAEQNTQATEKRAKAAQIAAEADAMQAEAERAERVAARAAALLA